MLKPDKFSFKNMGLDIVGDIHGHGNDLINLLTKLGYDNSSGVFSHPDRKVIFLGDFIDRGSNQRLVLDTVIPMIENGSAFSVMGNHEFNALAFHTYHNGTPLRPHNNKNIHQHSAFLDQIASDDTYLEKVLDFFYSLPLYIDLGDLRIVHACWHQDYISKLSTSLDEGRINKELLVKASTKGAVEYEMVETLLKGVEVKLPEDIYFADKDGFKRQNVRVEWWNHSTSVLNDLTIPSNIKFNQELTSSHKAQMLGYQPHLPPCFVGHYWKNGKPAPLANNLACLDYSIAKGGKLVAYQWDGEQNLSESKFIY